VIHQTTTPAGSTPPGTSCDRNTSVTRALIGYGVVAGPFYVLVSLTQALTRDGFDLTRHPWSLLSNGDLGWIHIANFVLTGLMTIAFAVGLRRAPGPAGPAGGSRWAPRLIAAYGASLVGAGLFRADPAAGFPPGTPDGPTEVSWHGMLHFGSGAIGFTCLIAACLVLGRRFAADRRPGWAAFSRITGVLFAAGFVGVAAGGGSTWTILGFTAAVILAWTWISALAAHVYGRSLRKD